MIAIFAYQDDGRGVEFELRSLLQLHKRCRNAVAFPKSNQECFHMIIRRYATSCGFSSFDEKQSDVISR